MFKFVSSIGNAAYKTATKTGLAAGDEMPPLPCALPLQDIKDSQDVYQMESILDDTFECIQELAAGNMERLNSVVADKARHKGWKSVDFVDSEGDLQLFSRPHVGPYNFALATVTLDHIPASMILREMHAQSLDSRKRYSNALKDYKVVLRNPLFPPALVGHDDDLLEELAEKGIRDWHIEYTSFYAPPPVANRDLFILIEKRFVPETNKYYIYGTSVNFPEADVPKKTNYVRGIVMFGWEFHHSADGMTHAKYVSCMNPNGWAPTFLVGWMKSEIAKEIQHSRRLLYELRSKSKESFLAAHVRKSLEKPPKMLDEQRKELDKKGVTREQGEKPFPKGSEKQVEDVSAGGDSTEIKEVEAASNELRGGSTRSPLGWEHIRSPPSPSITAHPSSRGYEGSADRDNESKEEKEVAPYPMRHSQSHHHHHHKKHCRHHYCHHCLRRYRAEYSDKNHRPSVTFSPLTDLKGIGTHNSSSGWKQNKTADLEANAMYPSKVVRFERGEVSQRKLLVEDKRVCEEEEEIEFF